MPPATRLIAPAVLALAAGCGLERDVTDADLDGYAAVRDCDDTDPLAHPGAPETCDGRDQDCDGRVDEGAVDMWAFYPDRDGDGFGVSAEPSWACTAPPKHADNADDCDDWDAAVHPGAIEVCDERDQDCDGDPDEGRSAQRMAWHADADGDGFGDPALAAWTCGPSFAGWVRDATDCDDAGPLAATTHPGVAWRDSASACTQDADGDGWGDVTPSSPAAAPGSDCDDVSAKARYTFPGSAALEGAGDCTLDQDGDGYGADRPAAPGVVAGQDCCDACPFNWQTWPGAAPFDSESACMRDHDGDGWGDASPEDPRVEAGTDCDDDASAIWPGVPEICDGVDQNCDGAVDEGASETWYTDADGDGFGDPEQPVQACGYSPGLSDDSTDCDDGDPAVYPGRREACDGVDQDCDGAVDEGLVAPYFPDADGDGYGDPAAWIWACTAPVGWVLDSSDCDDGDAGIAPDATEWCDGVDQDCDGVVDNDAFAVDWYLDADGDGWGLASEVLSDCAPPSGYVLTAGDCDDADAGAWPGAPEVACDGVDQDCDGLAEACHLLGDALAWGGETALDLAGNAVTGAGDVDGDGYDDLIVGAYCWDFTGSSAGAAYLQRGGPALAGGDLADADQVLRGVDADERAGWSVAGVGDVDGDGFGDLLVGAPYDSAAARRAGEIYLVSGSSSPADMVLSSATASWTGTAAYDMAGVSVAAAGDVDGDGLADMLIGAPDADSGGLNTGSAYLILGNASPTSGSLTAADVRYDGSVHAGSAGFSVAGAGDVDGDGLHDLLIGAPDVIGVYPHMGQVYLVLDALAAPVISVLDAEVTYTGSSQDRAGWSVAGAGDVDGDGLDDLLIGAQDHSTTASLAGAAYLVLGSAAPADRALSGADAIFLGEAAGDQAGSSVAGAGDVDGDGFADLLLGAVGADSTATDAGEAYLVRGGPGLGGGSLSLADHSFWGESSYDAAGSAVAGAGDVDGDGLSDLLVGAPGASAPTANAGAAYLILGASFAW